MQTVQKLEERVRLHTESKIVCNCILCTDQQIMALQNEIKRLQTEHKAEIGTFIVVVFDPTHVRLTLYR